MAFDASVGYGNNLISLIESLSPARAQTNQIKVPNKVKTVRSLSWNRIPNTVGGSGVRRPQKSLGAVVGKPYLASEVKMLDLFEGH